MARRFLILLNTIAVALRLPSSTPSRRKILALAPLLATAPPTIRPANAFLGIGDGGPRVQMTDFTEICQGRTKAQDFVVVRYVGRRTDNGQIFDDRYAKKPLCYELGSFYLPGVDEGLTARCVGSKFKFTWGSSPDLGREYASVLPPGVPIELELELVSIRYSLFGEKMRNASSTYWFAEGPLTLTSQPDYGRGFQNAGVEPLVTKDNPFSIAPGEKSLISNPASAIVPLFSGFFDGIPFLGSLFSSMGESE